MTQDKHIIDGQIIDALVIDTRGLNCPLPVLRLRKRLAALPPRAEVVLLATDRATLRDVPAFCAGQGHRLIATSEQDGELRFRVARADA